MKNILVLLPVEERHKETLLAAGPNCRFFWSDRESVSPETVRDADVIIGRPRAEMLNASPRLQWLQLSTAGADAYLKPGVLGKHTLLTNATGAYGQAVAEHGFAMTLMLQKKLHLYRDGQQQAVWRDLGPVSTLRGGTVVVVGLGDIGLYYARLVKAMGARVIGVKRRPSETPEGVDELVLADELPSVLSRADVVFNVLPGTPATYHLYTPELFERMKPSALFINCGRGSAVASETLYWALSEGKIAAAAVDVTEPEPLPADSPLWGLPNLVITPHIAGTNHLRETTDRIVDIAAKNLAAFLEGRPLENIVDWETGYKK